MLDVLQNLWFRLRGDSYDLTAVAVELLLIGLSVNWIIGVLQGTRGTRPLRGVLFVLVVVTLIVRVLAVQMGWSRLSLLYSYFLLGFAFIAVVVFQPELRRAIIRVGDVRMLRQGSPQSLLISALVSAAGQLSKNRHGALIAIERSVDLRGWAENGTMINAEVSANLLTSIFYPNSPLHDLGVIIRGTKVLAASCQFPSADSDEVDLALGSRHLAALGMSYETDALVLVVSEESGVISLADNGQLVRFLSIDDLSVELTQRLAGSSAGARRWGRPARHFSHFWRYARRALVVVPLAAAIWYLADQATLTKYRLPRVELRLQHAQPSYRVSPSEAAPVFSVEVIGSTRVIDRLRIETGEVFAVDAIVSDGPGAYQRPVRELLETAPALRQRGLTVQNAAPDHVKYNVDETVVLPLRVEVATGGRRVDEVRIEPAEVNVTIRRADQEKLGPEPRLTVSIEERLREHPGGGAVTLERVALPTLLNGAPTLALEPREVRVALAIVDQRVTRKVPGVGVRVLAGPALTQRHLFEPRDRNEWLIELELAGEPARLDALRPADVLAYVAVSSDDVRPSTDERFIERDVLVVVPEGITVASPPRRVGLRLVEREGGLP